MAGVSSRKDARKKSDKYSKNEIVRQRLYDFKDEVHTVGKKAHARVKEGDFTYDNWFYRTFGAIGPFFSSVFGLLMLLLFAWILDYSAVFLSSTILMAFHDLIYQNLQSLFIILLFFAYSSYISRHHPKAYLPFSPLLRSTSAVIFLWLIAGSIDAINQYQYNDVLDIISWFIGVSIIWLFLLFVFIGYLIFVIKLIVDKPSYGEDKAFGKKDKSDYSRPQNIGKYDSNRLYRSGHERVLGGVCGGIAEYLGVDPVIIRILWIAATLAWGLGVWLYIIAWIIIPRNPRDKW